MGTGECMQTLKGHGDWVRSAVFSPDGCSVLTASRDETAKLWNITTGECMQTLKGNRAYLTSAVFSSDGCSVLTASGYDETVKVWNATTGECMQTLDHGGWVRSAVFSP